MLESNQEVTLYVVKGGGHGSGGPGWENHNKIVFCFSTKSCSSLRVDYCGANTVMDWRAILRLGYGMLKSHARCIPLQYPCLALVAERRNQKTHLNMEF